MDWADEIAKEIIAFNSQGYDGESVLATALRKAKADGMREAIVALSTAVLDGKFDGLGLVRELVLSADAIEKGTE